MSRKLRTFWPTINSRGFCPNVYEREYIIDGHKRVSRNQIAIIHIDYPTSHKFVFRRTSKNGWTQQKLVNAIKSIYKNKIYKDPNGYGVWGHSKEDLVIERIQVTSSIVRNTIIVTMFIGS